MLDLFGGSGQMAIEALSRGAKDAVIVDQSKDSISIIRQNLKKTRLDGKAETICSDYMEYLNRTKKHFDLVFLDPPYREKLLENALKRISEIDILKSGGIIVCERPAEKALPNAYKGFYWLKDYRYGKTGITIYRGVSASNEITGGNSNE